MNEILSTMASVQIAEYNKYMLKRFPLKGGYTTITFNNEGKPVCGMQVQEDGKLDNYLIPKEELP